MTTNGGGWTVVSFLRYQYQWDYGLFEDNGKVKNVTGGFSAGATLRYINATFSEKIVIFLALEELGEMLGKQWMMNNRSDPVPFSSIDTPTGWSYTDSFGYKTDLVDNVCVKGCVNFRTFGLFGSHVGSNGLEGYCGTQGQDLGCRDGNNICWGPRSLSCVVYDKRCALLTGDGEGVIYAVR